MQKRNDLNNEELTLIVELTSELIEKIEKKAPRKNQVPILGVLMAYMSYECIEELVNIGISNTTGQCVDKLHRLGLIEKVGDNYRLINIKENGDMKK